MTVAGHALPVAKVAAASSATSCSACGPTTCASPRPACPRASSAIEDLGDSAIVSLAAGGPAAEAERATALPIGQRQRPRLRGLRARGGASVRPAQGGRGSERRRAPTTRMDATAKNKPNVVLILNDDMGYSDLGCYGGEIETPNLDRLARDGLRFSQFYNTARCSPSRASMLTGLHPHQTGVGILTYDSGPGRLCRQPEQALRHHSAGAQGQRLQTYMSGKWHVASSLTQADRHLAAAARLRRVLRHHHRRRQLLRSQHADARQRQHRARGQGRPQLLLHRRHQRPGRRLHRQAPPRAAARRRSSPTSPTPRRTGRCTRTTRTSPSTRAASTRAGTGCARSGSTSWSSGASSTLRGS